MNRALQQHTQPLSKAGTTTQDYEQGSTTTHTQPLNKAGTTTQDYEQGSTTTHTALEQG